MSIKHVLVELQVLQPVRRIVLVYGLAVLWKIIVEYVIQILVIIAQMTVQELRVPFATDIHLELKSLDFLLSLSVFAVISCGGYHATDSSGCYAGNSYLSKSDRGHNDHAERGPHCCVCVCLA